MSKNKLICPKHEVTVHKRFGCYVCKIESLEKEIEELKHDNTKLVEALSNYVVLKPDELAEIENICRTANRIRQRAFIKKDSETLDSSQHIIDIVGRLLGVASRFSEKKIKTCK